MTKRFVYIVALFTLMALSVPDLRAENVLFHVKTALNKDDAQICVAHNVALAALLAGDEVTILFDASAVTSITKGWGWFLFGEKTPMDAAALPERERAALNQQTGIPLQEIPQNYGQYLTFLKKRGAKLFVNRTMLTLYKIDPADMDKEVSPIQLSDMLKLFKQAERIIVY